MKKAFRSKNSGFIGLIITLIIALAFAKYFFNFNIVDFIKSPKVSEVFDYIKRAVLIVWNTLLVGPLRFVWEKIIIDIVWKAIVLFYDTLKHWVDSRA